MKLTDLKVALVIVAVVEACYAAAGLLIPPNMISTVLGWQLTPDGHWITKLLGVALGTQAALAWVLRHKATPAIALIFAAYQIGASTVDWVMWLSLADDGIFANSLARFTVALAIPTHYLVGLLLIIAAVRHSKRGAAHV